MLTIVNKQIMLTAVLFFILGITAMYFYTRSEIENSKNLTKQVVNNCGNALIATNGLINNCSEAYREFGTCVTHPESCDLQTSMKKLEQLNKDKEDLNLKLAEITKEITTIMSQIKK